AVSASRRESRGAESSRSRGPCPACCAARSAAASSASLPGALGSARASRLTTHAARVGRRNAPIALAAARSPALRAAAASSPRRPVNASGSAPYSSSAAAVTRSPVVTPSGPLPTERLCPAAQPREQVVLREWRAHRVGLPDEVLVAEYLLHELRRHLAEPRVVDLAAMREQRRPLAREDRPDVDRGGDPRLGLQSPLPAFPGLRRVAVPVLHFLARLAPPVPDLPPVGALHRGQVHLRGDPGRHGRGLGVPAGVH